MYINVKDTLIDSGASACFIDVEFVIKHGIARIKKNRPAVVRVIDGRKVSSGEVTEITKPLVLKIGNHDEKIVFNIIRSPSYPVILGMPWLKFHNPAIDWRKLRIIFRCSCKGRKEFSKNMSLYLDNFEDFANISPHSAQNQGISEGIEAKTLTNITKTQDLFNSSPKLEVTPVIPDPFDRNKAQNEENMEETLPKNKINLKQEETPASAISSHEDTSLIPSLSCDKSFENSENKPNDYLGPKNPFTPSPYWETIKPSRINKPSAQKKYSRSTFRPPSDTSEDSDSVENIPGGSSSLGNVNSSSFETTSNFENPVVLPVNLDLQVVKPTYASVIRKKVEAPLDNLKNTQTGVCQSVSTAQPSNSKSTGCSFDSKSFCKRSATTPALPPDNPENICLRFVETSAKPNNLSCNKTQPNNKANYVSPPNYKKTRDSKQILITRPKSPMSNCPKSCIVGCAASDIPLLIEEEQEKNFNSDEGECQYDTSFTQDLDAGDKPTIIPEIYKEYSDVFSKIDADILPENRPYDCPIDIKEGSEPPFGPIYSLSLLELKVLKEYIEDNLRKGFIRPSKSPAASPILFVKKKDGSLRLCVDYRGLNRITIRNRYPLPLIPELLDRLSTASIFTKIDLRGAYNLVRIRPGDEWKTSFRCRYGQYEYLVMPFGLTNAPAVFQFLMNDILREFLDFFVVVYLDDILIYSNSEEEHIKHVKLVLQRLRENKLYAKLEKCSFHKQDVEFLGYIVSDKGVSMDPTKISSIKSWPVPASIRDVQCFLGFANFYRQFIKNFSRRVLPLTSLIKKGKKFVWDKDSERAFITLKDEFIKAPLLKHPNLELPFYVETDSSDFAIGAALLQKQGDEELYPVAFFSRKFTASEINYEVHDKELSAIVYAFRYWRRFLEGAAHTVVVFSDHRNLQYFTTSKLLNRRQARWAMYLSEFDFKVVYRPGSKQILSDALSRRPDYCLKADEVACSNQRQELLIPMDEEANVIAMLSPSDETLLNKIKHRTKDDQWVKKHRNDIISGKMKYFTLEDELVLRNNLIYVPNDKLRLEVLSKCHDSPIGGHAGIQKTIELVTRNYWWPKLTLFVEQYVRSCETCAMAKASRHKPYGKLMPIPIPGQPWKSISLDFITDLPRSAGFDSVLVVVDRFTKMAHFEPCAKDITAKGCTDIMMKTVFKLHGLPNEIISDRGPQFVSKFWTHVMNALGAKAKLSSAYHPETDGQTERVNQILEQYLRCNVNYLQNNWVNLLPLAEICYNNLKHTSTGVTPYYSNYGYHPKFDFSSKPTNCPSSMDYINEIQSTHELMQANLNEAQIRYKQYADEDRCKAPQFKVGDKVWLRKTNIRTERPSAKLDYKKVGPFRIVDVINETPYDWRYHQHGKSITFSMFLC